MTKQSTHLTLLALLALLAPAGTAFAALAPGTPPGTGFIPGGEFSWWGYVQAIGVMFLVLGLLWAALWLLRRSGRFAGIPRADTLPRDALYLERQLSLGPRKGLVVVRFLNKRLLLGVTEQQITLLTETTPHDVPSPQDALAFQRCLDNAAARPDEAPPSEPRTH